MDDFGSTVVGRAHDVGIWRGPANRPWLRRIAHGAGFTFQWDLAQLPDESEPDSARSTASTPAPTAPAPAAPAPAPAAADPFPAQALRMWWLPSAHDR